MAPNSGAVQTSGSGGLANGWWKAYLETIPGGYLDLLAAEEDASRIVHFHPTFVPGLLQTESYAAAITPATTLKAITSDDARTLVHVKLSRQRAALEGSRLKELVFLMDETALRRPVGSPATMRDQLSHLLEMAEHPMVTLVVVPFGGQPHPGLLGAFMLMQYGGGLDDVLCFEWQMGNQVIRNQPGLIGRYRELAEDLAGADPDGTAARERIASALAENHEPGR